MRAGCPVGDTIPRSGPRRRRDHREWPGITPGGVRPRYFGGVVKDLDSLPPYDWNLLDRYWTASLLFLALGVAVFAPWWAFGRVVAPLDVLTELYEPWADDNRSVEVYNHFTCDAVIEFLIYQPLFLSLSAISRSSVRFFSANPPTWRSARALKSENAPGVTYIMSVSEPSFL